MAHITRIRVENIRGCELADIAPTDKGLTIGGENGEGKTSILDAVVAALGGKKYLPVDPVRFGAAHGGVMIEMQEGLSINLTVDPDRSTELLVKIQGNKISSPQKHLDKLFGPRNAFDPGAFINMDMSTRRNTLMDMAKISFIELDRRRKEVYDERRMLGREIGIAEAKLAGAVVDPTLPDKEVSAAEIVAELEAANRISRQREAVEREMIKASSVLAKLSKENEESISSIAFKESEIERLKAEILAEQNTIKLRGERQANGEKYLADKKAELDAIVVPNTEAISAKAKELEEKNARIRANIETKQLFKVLETKQAEASAMTSEIEGIDNEKNYMVARAKLPLEGLGFNDTGVTWQGRAFEAASESEKWDISTAIAFALNPQGIVFIRQSAGLSKKSRDRVRGRAAALGVQLFMEVVDDAEDVQVVIEAGKVKVDRLAKTS